MSLLDIFTYEDILKFAEEEFEKKEEENDE